MAYPEDALAAGEQLVLHKHPHWKLLVGPVLVMIAVVAVVGFLAGAVREQSWAGPAWVVLGVAGSAAVVWFTGGALLRWRTTHFVLTNRRILVREGLFTRTGIDIPVARVNSVQFRHGILDRMLGTGTLVVESASEDPLEFDDVPQVERVHALLYNEVFDASSAPRREPADLEPGTAQPGWRG